MSTIEKTTIEAKADAQPDVDAKPAEHTAEELAIEEKVSGEGGEKSIAETEKASAAAIEDENTEPFVATEEKPVATEKEKPAPETLIKTTLHKSSLTNEHAKESDTPAVETPVETETHPTLTRSDEKPAVETVAAVYNATIAGKKRQAEEGSTADDESADKKNKTVA